MADEWATGTTTPMVVTGDAPLGDKKTEDDPDPDIASAALLAGEAVPPIVGGGGVAPPVAHIAGGVVPPVAPIAGGAAQPLVQLANEVVPPIVVEAVPPIAGLYESLDKEESVEPGNGTRPPKATEAVMPQEMATARIADWEVGLAPPDVNVALAAVQRHSAALTRAIMSWMETRVRDRPVAEALAAAQGRQAEHDEASPVLSLQMHKFHWQTDGPQDAWIFGDYFSPLLNLLQQGFLKPGLDHPGCFPQCRLDLRQRHRDAEKHKWILDSTLRCPLGLRGQYSPSPSDHKAMAQRRKRAICLHCVAAGTVGSCRQDWDRGRVPASIWRKPPPGIEALNLHTWSRASQSPPSDYGLSSSSDDDEEEPDASTNLLIENATENSGRPESRLVENEENDSNATTNEDLEKDVTEAERMTKGKDE